MREGKLYVIATPIGNYRDITLRALETIRKLEYFLVEDTREFSRLLNLHGISLKRKHLHSFAQHNMKKALKWAQKIWERNESLGLLSDRGTPNISDPGAEAVKLAWQLGITVEPIPGPSAITTFLSAIGWEARHFYYQGFLPHSLKEQQKLWQWSYRQQIAILFFSPSRNLLSSLKVSSQIMPEAQVYLAREMTKEFETFYHFTLKSNWHNMILKGEWVGLLIPPPFQAPPSEIETCLKAYLGGDKTFSKWIGQYFSLSPRKVYNDMMRLKHHKKSPPTRR